VLIGFVTILVMVATFGAWMRKRQQESEMTEFEMLEKPRLVERVESRFKSPSEAEAREIVGKALASKDEAAVLENFRLTGGQAGEVLQFLRDEVERKGAASVDSWLGSIDPNNALVEGLVVKRKKDGEEASSIAMLTPDVSGVWRLDFDSFAGRCEPSWGSFVSGEAAEGIARIWFSSDNYFNGEFVDEKKWICYSLARAESDVLVFGYCRAGSQQAATMQKIMDRVRMMGKPNASSFRAVLALARPMGAEKRQFEIKRVLAEDWLMTDVAFDGSTEPLR